MRRTYDYYDEECFDMWYERKHSCCCKQGPTGPAGPAGPPGADGISTVIKGSYDTLCELIIDHPIGERGDAYIVDGDLYIWNETIGEYGQWERISTLIGPTGPTAPHIYAQPKETA